MWQLTRRFFFNVEDQFKALQVKLCGLLLEEKVEGTRTLTINIIFFVIPFSYSRGVSK